MKKAVLTAALSFTLAGVCGERAMGQCSAADRIQKITGEASNPHLLLITLPQSGLKIDVVQNSDTPGDVTVQVGKAISSEEAWDQSSSGLMMTSFDDITCLFQCRDDGGITIAVGTTSDLQIFEIAPTGALLSSYITACICDGTGFTPSACTMDQCFDKVNCRFDNTKNPPVPHGRCTT